ncbi:dipeptide ABC transporter ATP-binding protein [Humitalea sp. 24SJ18S-53]|uniref:dipeptide ABC transporter ATP-binding protein n=1 Tax=Humitalea sp. 24SJ18S-53 TaxID=3422307 RepID=UPI003D676CAE
MTTPVLEVQNLSVDYGPLKAVRDISFSIAPGEALGLIGESGSGKSTVAFALMRHLRGGAVRADRMALQGEDLLAMPQKRLAVIRGASMAMVYQDPMSALNPLIRVGEQIAEALRRHTGLARDAAWQRAVALLDQVELPRPAEMARRYPHQLSGGQQQRVVIAMAIACRPALLIMDEPTTGLDVTTEAVILDLIRVLRREIGAAVLFISHNLAVVGQVCDRVGVLYGGEFVEQGTAQEVLRRPRHPYTIGLMQALPRPEAARTSLATIPGRLPDLRQVPSGCIFAPRCGFATDICTTRPALDDVATGHASRCHFRDTVTAPPLPPIPTVDRAARATAVPRLDLQDLRKWYGRSAALPFLPRPDPVRALDGVSLSIGAGETHALVGESGSGKSTLAQCVAGLLPADGGGMQLDGRHLAPKVERRSRADQQAVQFVFQNPESALNPRWTVGDTIGRPLRLYQGLSGAALRARILELLDAVKLGERFLQRYPRELSGGEKQRVGIARAFAANPRLVICDEPTSALDISVQASVLNELAALQARTGTSYLFITHDLGVVRNIADTVTILYGGIAVEHGKPEQVFAAPHHPYTEALVAAIPRHDAAPDHARLRLQGRPVAAKQGCVFHTRCPRKLGSICEQEAPPWRPAGAGHGLACHIPIDVLQAKQSAMVVEA